MTLGVAIAGRHELSWTNVFSILIQIGLENVAWELTKTILSMYRIMITQQIEDDVCTNRVDV